MLFKYIYYIAEFFKLQHITVGDHHLKLHDTQAIILILLLLPENVDLYIHSHICLYGVVLN
jgi:hypothetical protein